MIFEQFVRGGASAHRYRGSGLGLPIVAAIAVSHGGGVFVASSGDRWIDLYDHAATRCGTVSRILIAEDDRLISSFIDKGLRAQGYATHTVEDGAAALSLLCPVSSTW